jgi:hypothetical protein
MVLPDGRNRGSTSYPEGYALAIDLGGWLL